MDFKGKKILVAEDQAFMRLGMVKLLVDIGFEEINVVACENGKVAYDILKAGVDEFDIVISDWNMPKMNGFELLKAIRSAKGYFKNIPFVLVTTVSEKEKVVEALNYNVAAYLLKPVQPPKLQESITRIFTEGDV